MLVRDKRDRYIRIIFFVEAPKSTRIRYTVVSVPAAPMTSAAFLTLVSHVTIVSQALVRVPSLSPSPSVSFFADCVMHMDSYGLTSRGSPRFAAEIEFSSPPLTRLERSHDPDGIERV